ncbi:hypothetical protein DMC63_01435 [Streptomyces sp. WAC 05977]|nr:hypothetical protein DMC63_01435 [Streptomyces sp. WAC 05977]
MTLDPGQPTTATDLKHWRELAHEAAWFIAAILALLFLGPTDQLAFVMAAVILHNPNDLEPPK